MYTEMTKAYDDMIGLWLLKTFVRHEKTHLNDSVEIGGLCV